MAVRRIAEIDSSVLGMAIADAVFPVSVIFSLYYFGAAVAHDLTQAGLAREVMPVLSLVTSALFFAQGWRWRTRAPSPDRIITWFVLILAVNNAVVLVLTGQEDAFFGQMIAQLGLGLVGVSWRAFGLLTPVIAAPIGFGLLFGPGIPSVGSPVLLYGSAFLLSFIAQLLSNRYRERLAGAQAESERLRQAAEVSLLRFQEETIRRERLQERLSHADRLESLGLLAGGVAHDFNNLLAVIVGRASALQERTLASEVRTEVEAILEAADRASLLSRELLAYAGRSTRVSAPVDLVQEVAAVSRLARSTLPAGVELSLPDSKPAEVVLADRGQIQQIVLNLVINAGDAMARGGGVIRVETGHVELGAEQASLLEPAQSRPEGAYCYVRVSDTGTGMTPEVRKHIFDPFFTTKPSGRGLGLAAALGIARVHGGGFDVRTEAGAGSVFTLYLPTSTEPAPPPVVARASLRPEHEPLVLVVDDQQEVREMVSTVLQRCGYRTALAAGGREAVALLAECPDTIALAIVDMSMPDMDGEATFIALRAVREDLPVLLSSGFDAHESASRLAHLPGVDFLPKPYRLAELQARVEALIAG